MDGGVKHGTKFNKSVVSLLHLLLLLPVVRIMVVEVAASEGLDPSSKQPCSLRDPAMNPTHQVRYGHDVVWQIPPDPKAVLLLVHGGGMESLQFFDPGPNCRQCYGRPECRTAVLEALQRGYAVISVTGFQIDSQIVSTIAQEWMVQHSLACLPLTAWGHSAGTFLLTLLTQTLPMCAIVLMCGSGSDQVENSATPQGFPPTLFVYMPRDVSVAKFNITNHDVEALAVLAARGVEVASIPVFPKPLSPLLFAERILCMSEEMSQSIYAALEAAGWMDSEGYLIRNPAEEDFESVLLKAKALPYCVESGHLCLTGDVQQELTAAYAEHSFTNDANDVIFAWLDTHVLSSSGAEETDVQSPALIATI